jgi:hypothetical protein
MSGPCMSAPSSPLFPLPLSPFLEMVTGVNPSHSFLASNGHQDHAYNHPAPSSHFSPHLSLNRAARPPKFLVGGLHNCRHLQPIPTIASEPRPLTSLLSSSSALAHPLMPSY